MKNIIKALIKKLGMTQEALAMECGFVRQTINCIENDKYYPTLELAFKIAKALNRKFDEVLYMSKFHLEYMITMKD
ncbi:helix-turn-helix transcriptional regulator, partial [Lysinibacillus agricola]|uniref:helix-turn-helix transcriptional regulator n=1 Tax=Lysinibacillus agricola TaxID=2590012 RepID=UPI003C1F16B8